MRETVFRDKGQALQPEAHSYATDSMESVLEITLALLTDDKPDVNGQNIGCLRTPFSEESSSRVRFTTLFVEPS